MPFPSLSFLSAVRIRGEKGVSKEMATLPILVRTLRFNSNNRHTNLLQLGMMWQFFCMKAAPSSLTYTLCKSPKSSLYLKLMSHWYTEKLLHTRLLCLPRPFFALWKMRSWGSSSWVTRWVVRWLSPERISHFSSVFFQSLFQRDCDRRMTSVCHHILYSPPVVLFFKIPTIYLWNGKLPKICALLSFSATWSSSYLIMPTSVADLNKHLLGKIWVTHELCYRSVTHGCQLLSAFKTTEENRIKPIFWLVMYLFVALTCKTGLTIIS